MTDVEDTRTHVQEHAPSGVPGRKYCVGPVADFKTGSWRLARIGGREIGIYNRGDRLFAVRNRCPHEGAPLCIERLRGTMRPSKPGQYDVGHSDRVLACPWHGWEFDIETGSMLFGTGDLRLRRYSVTVEDEVVFVNMDNPE